MESKNRQSVGALYRILHFLLLESEFSEFENFQN